jgi:hypothetical protein
LGRKLQQRHPPEWPDQHGAVDASPHGALAAKEDGMSIIPKLVALGLAATLSSPIQQRQIDYSTGAPDNQRITQLWLVTYVNEKGLEVVAQAKLESGDYAPLIAADFERLASILPAARDLLTTRNIKMRLIKLTNRVDIEEILP